jgi:hypothetical protein
VERVNYELAHTPKLEFELAPKPINLANLNSMTNLEILSSSLIDEHHIHAKHIWSEVEADYIGSVGNIRWHLRI